MLYAVAELAVESPRRSWRGIGGNFWSDPLGEIGAGIQRSIFDPVKEAAKSFESSTRHSLADVESDVRNSLKDFEQRNRETIQLAGAGAACAVGSAYLGPAAAPLVCLPMNAKLGLVGSPGVLVDPTDASDPLAADAAAWAAAHPDGSAPASTSSGPGLVAVGLVLLLLAVLS